MRCHDDLIQFILDTLATDDLDAVDHPLQSDKGLVFDLEVQLCGKADATHHAQRIVAESDIRLQCGGDDTILKISQSVEGIDEFAKTLFIQTDRHRIDSEVATVLVVLQGSILHDGLARVMAVALLASADELDFEDLRSQETGVRSQEITIFPRFCRKSILLSPDS